MNKTHIRSYCVGDEGDLVVLAYAGGKPTELSPHYSDLPRDRRALRVDTSLDVFRYENGDLGWSLSPNGHDVGSAASTRLLVNLFLEDAAGTAGEARAL